MRKLVILFVSIYFSFASFAAPVGVENPSISTNSEKEILIRNQRLLDRLEEINAMDKSTMSRSEKRELRREVKEIQKTMEIGGGVYISVGALILILILLIILL